MTSIGNRRGFTLFMTGLPAAGKSTIANRLMEVIQKEHHRPVTVLDGDVVREMLSSGLGYSRPDRELNIRRIGYVAGEITKHGGICVCAAIAPFANVRREVRARVTALGSFYEIHVATPLAVCEARDPKGLYKKARRGEIKGVTGLDAPFEEPEHAELVIDTSQMTLDEEVQKILALPRRDSLL